MKVAYRLEWQSQSPAATALLVLEHDATELLRVCAQIGAASLPSVFAVADGFVVMLPGPSDDPFVGTIRLRGLSENLLVPVNAELIPPLLADEASALVKKRGLVFLPGGRVLEFDLAATIAPSSLMRLGPVTRSSWAALPVPATLADDIHEITQVGSDASAADVFMEGGEGIGTDGPAPDEKAGLPAQVAGGAMFQLGKSLAWLGQKLNSPMLAGMGAKLLGGAMALAPALTQKLMGAQEAMLRKLLRQFREGNIDDALMHALPLGGDPQRGAGFAGNAQLPTHNLFYSLINLLGRSGNAAGSMWLTADQTYWDLMQEYRKQAEAAVRRGDFRRAAFIHAKLLNDFHAAAKILAQGGLHRDAAILYEKKLHDSLSAAREWEAAGEFDRAIQLFWQVGDHAAAGDLLRRIGEEERAVQEYRIAAAKLVETGPKHFEAGELLRVRGQRPDLARPYYQNGWQARPAGQALACARRLVQDHADGGAAEPFLAVLTEAEEFLIGFDAESTASLLTDIARLAHAPGLADIADEVHDRALVGIARKMQDALAHGGPQRGLANLFKTPAVWAPPLIGDSQYALTEASKRAATTRPAFVTVQAGRSTVTAACSFRHLVFLGFQNGEIACFQPDNNAAFVVSSEKNGPIWALSADACDINLLVLSQQGPDKACLHTLSPEAGYERFSYTILDATVPVHMGVPALNCRCEYAVIGVGVLCLVLSHTSLVGAGTLNAGDLEYLPEMVIYGTMPNGGSDLWLIAFGSSRAEIMLWDPPRKQHRYALEWSPAVGAKSTLVRAPVHAILMEGVLEITGLDDRGRLCRSLVPFNKLGAETVVHARRGGGRYGAFARVRGDLFAGIHEEGIDWWAPLRAAPLTTKLTLRNPIAAFPLSESNELLIVESDGLLTRVPIAG